MALKIFMGFFQILALLVVFASILFLAYVTTRYVGAKAGKTMKGKYVNVVETVSLGMDKRIYLVKAGNKHFLLASSGKNLEFLTDVTIDETAEDIEQPISGNFEFKNIFDKYVQSFKTMVSDKKTDSGRAEERPEAVTKAGDEIKTNLNRLKNITVNLNKQDREDKHEFTKEK